jgi:hypothetical protein
MKAFSIIGIVLSLVQVALSFMIMDISCYSEWGTDQPGLLPGFACFVLGAFFLALSIAACVTAFRKKKPSA